MSLTKKIVFELAIILLLPFFVPMMYYEILTAIHLDEFTNIKEQFEEINICDPPKAAVVIEYSKDKAVLYCYDNNCGNLATFVKQEGQWVIEAIDTRWARSGNADERVWPYILHPTFGWLFGESWPRGNLS